MKHKQSIVKSVIIWVLCFFASGTLLVWIANAGFDYLWAVLVLSIPTLVTAKFVPIYGIYGGKFDPFIIMLRYSLAWFCTTGMIFQIDGLFSKDEVSAIAALLIVFFTGLYIHFARKSLKKNPGYKKAKAPLHASSKNVPLPLKTSHPPAPRQTEMSCIDKMEGHEFEAFTADLLRKLGYERVKVTPGSGDQGVDVIAVKDGKKYAIQCKRYGQKLGNKPVQEVHAGKTIYGCSVAVVLTNNYFTEGGKEAARALGVELWDRDKLERMLTYAAHMEERSTC